MTASQIAHRIDSAVFVLVMLWQPRRAIQQDSRSHHYPFISCFISNEIPPSLSP